LEQTQQETREDGIARNGLLREKVARTRSNSKKIRSKTKKEGTIMSEAIKIDNASKMVWVTFQKEGMHKYPAALTDPKLATGDEYDVSFLGHPHRHMFHFKIAIEVFHDDRDIEFIQFKRWILNLYNQGTLQNDYKSL
jgi:hypothetical protein